MLIYIDKYFRRMMMDNNVSTASQVAEGQVQESTPTMPLDTQSTWMSLVPIVLIFFVMYFLLIRPQEKKRREHEEMIRQAKKGETVITAGGIYGVITKVDDKEGTVLLEIAKDVQIKVLKTAITEFADRKKIANNK
jgi:preprotein translocase subunit YajC